MPSALASQYVSQLNKHPADTDTREKLAVLYAENFGRLDLAVDQLEQLIALPEETPKHVTRWLNLLATLHISVANDEAERENGAAAHRGKISKERHRGSRNAAPCHPAQ